MTNVEEHRLTAAYENVPGPSTSAIEISDDESSFNMTTAQDQEMEMDAALFEEIKKGKKDEIRDIELRMITGKESYSEQVYCLINDHRLSERTIEFNCKTQLQSFSKRIEMWQTKYASTVRTVNELKKVVDHLKKNSYGKPITRSVGSQVDLKPKKNRAQLNIKTPLKSTTVHSATPRDPIIEEPVIILNDVNNKRIVNDLKKSDIPSTSNLKIIGKTPLNKISRSPIINKPSSALLTKKGRPSVPNKIVCSIDLTENDDEVNLNTQTTNNNQQLTKQGLTQLSTDSNVTLNSINLLTSGRRFLCKNCQLLPCHFSPIGTNDLQMQSNIIQPRIISSGIIPQPVSPSTSLRPVPAAKPLFSQHPAPPPLTYSQPNNLDSWKKLPPAPTVKLKQSRKQKSGAVLEWTLDNLTEEYANLKRYELYSYYEVTIEMPTPDIWKHIGSVEAVPLPIICPLSQFKFRGKYHFIVRAVDEHDRYGPFSTPLDVTF